MNSGLIKLTTSKVSSDTFHSRNLFRSEGITMCFLLLSFSLSPTHLSVFKIPPLPCVRCQFIEFCDWECERFLLMLRISSLLRLSWSLDDVCCFDEYRPPPSLQMEMAKCKFYVPKSSRAAAHPAISLGGNKTG